VQHDICFQDTDGDGTQNEGICGGEKCLSSRRVGKHEVSKLVEGLKQLKQAENACFFQAVLIVRNQTLLRCSARAVNGGSWYRVGGEIWN